MASLKPENESSPECSTLPLIRESPINSSDDETSIETPSSYVSTPISGHHHLCRLKKFASTPALHGLNTNYNSTASDVQIPIVGYEVMEERARFTVYKLRITNPNFGDSWFVFRRYTDFVRLHSKLRSIFPQIKLALPRKRWFGNNFDSRFIENRVKGLQGFIDELTSNEDLMTCEAVRDFFCLDQPPSSVETCEENRVMFEALEETIYSLRIQLLTKENEIENIKSNLVQAHEKNNELVTLIRERSRNCESCWKHLRRFVQNNDLISNLSSVEKLSPLCTSSPLSTKSNCKI